MFLEMHCYGKATPPLSPVWPISAQQTQTADVQTVFATMYQNKRVPVITRSLWTESMSERSRGHQKLVGKHAG